MNIGDIIALVLGIGAIIVVVIQLMYPTIPKYIGWPIIGVLFVTSTILIGPKYFGVWQWPIIGLIILVTISLFIYFWRKRNVAAKSDIQQIKNTTKSHPRRERAIEIHNQIMGLETRLWETRDKLPDTEDSLKNPEVKHIMDELQAKMNELGHLVNNSDYDRFAEVLMGMYSKDLEFNISMHDNTGMWGRARINSKFPWYINHKVKG